MFFWLNLPVLSFSVRKNIGQKFARFIVNSEILYYIGRRVKNLVKDFLN